MLPTVPPRETVIRKCRICGDKIEDPTKTAAKICYSCWLFKQIPGMNRYQKREEYARFTTNEKDPIRNATKTPRTGVPFMDIKKTLAWDIFCNPAAIIELRFREQQQGLDEGEYWHPKVYS